MMISILNPPNSSSKAFAAYSRVTAKRCKKLGIKLSPRKARIILHDKEVRGRKLTAKQRRFFGFVSGGCKKGKRRNTASCGSRVKRRRNKSKSKGFRMANKNKWASAFPSKAKIKALKRKYLGAAMRGKKSKVARSKAMKEAWKKIKNKCKSLRRRKVKCSRGPTRRRRRAGARALGRWRRKGHLSFRGRRGRCAAATAARYMALCHKGRRGKRKLRKNMPSFLRNIPYILRNKKRRKHGKKKARRNFGIASIKARAQSALRNWKDNILWLGVGLAAPKLLAGVGSKLPVVGPLLASFSSGIPGVVTAAGLGIIASELAHRYIGYSAGQMVELGAGAALLGSILSLDFIPMGSTVKGLVGLSDQLEFMHDFIPLSDFPEVNASAPDENWMVNSPARGNSNALYESAAIYGGEAAAPACGGTMQDFLEFSA